MKKLIYITTLLLSGLVACVKPIERKPLSLAQMPARFQNNAADSIALPVPQKFLKDPLLLNLLDSAKRYNPDLLSAYQKIEIARAGVMQSRAPMAPSLSVGTINGIRKFGLYTMDGAGNITTDIIPGKIVPIHLPDFYLGAMASWEIDLWGKLKSLKKAALANYLQSIEGKRFLQSSLNVEIAAAYLNLLSLDQKAALINLTIKRQEEALEAILKQKEAGRANELAVQQFKAQMNEFQILRNELTQQIKLNENLINFLVGRYPQSISRAQVLDSLTLPTMQGTGLPSQLLHNRPDVKAAALEVEKTGYMLQSAKAAFLPTFNMVAGLGFQAFEPQRLFMMPQSYVYNAAGSLMAPLVNRRALKANYSQANAAQIDALYQYQKSILNAYTEVANSLTNISTLESNLRLRRERANALRMAVEAAGDLFQSSRATYLDVLLARQAELDARWEYIGNQLDLNIARLNLYKSLGGFAVE